MEGISGDSCVKGDSCEGRKGSDTQAEGGQVDRWIVRVDMAGLIAETVM